MVSGRSTSGQNDRLARIILSQNNLLMRRLTTRDRFVISLNHCRSFEFSSLSLGVGATEAGASDSGR